VYVAARPPVQERADGKLRVADVNANTAGAHAIATALGLAVKPVAELATAPGIRTVVMLGDILPGLPSSHVAELAVIALSPFETNVVANAKVALPIAAWAETPGTITNDHGRVQRMHAAFGPPGQALPGWDAVVRLAQATGVKLSWAHARDVFKDMTQAVPAWKSLVWARESRPLALRFAGSRG
jgi:NADH dehydrogenase/NADH:ubiquinone oxidoreductase subunit G